MRAITYSSFRNNLKESIRQIREDAEPLLVTNKDAEDNIIVMNQSDYDSLMETVRIYRNPAMVEKILRGMRQAQHGDLHEHGLLDEN
ncbi:prevent-host-death protein [Bifidobacterium italicum]|uniref:Antitoxin n=1 Tax=Bifidobacterium italicum TaxID=1960968 RepID=A0A2A2ELX3_9BIFI|nr:type II toxin-antitoxin system prevent-host-death family antitoxin [Bifidobacterium italicum]PAU70043.1 prevent-host-death protein [Bifidobacterium italicum]